MPDTSSKSVSDMALELMRKMAGANKDAANKLSVLKRPSGKDMAGIYKRPAAKGELGGEPAEKAAKAAKELGGKPAEKAAKVGLEYMGIAKSLPRRYNGAIVYTSSASKKWRVMKKGDRQDKAFSWDKNDPESVWGRVVAYAISQADNS